MNTSSTKNSAFISFEGLDFSGKSTQIGLLTEHLRSQGIQFELIREPGGTPISERIREILLDLEHKEMTNICELFLYSAARHQLVKQKIKKSLEKGISVIADRYVDSTTAYQGYGRQLPLSFISQLNRIATEDLMPDLTFFLDLTYDDMIKRKDLRTAGSDRLETQGREFYERIRNGYLQIAERNHERFKVIDANQPVQHISSEIREFVEDILLSKIKL
jgi:dTMP kinase